MDLANLTSFNNLLMNITANYSSSSSCNRRKRIRAPDSLRSPLAPIWIEPVETWRALVTEDVLIDTNSKLDFSRNNSVNNSESGNSSMSNTGKVPSRRYTSINMTDLNSVSNNLASLNIFSGLRLSKSKKCSNHNNSSDDYDREYYDNDRSTRSGHNEMEEENETKKVSDGLRVAKARLTIPIYLKSGPGYDDFGYVSTQELIKVRDNTG
jgi:hypothetical protein